MGRAARADTPDHAIRIAAKAALPEDRWNATLNLTGNARTRTATTTVTVPTPTAPAQTPNLVGAIALDVGLLAPTALLAVLVLGVRRRAPQRSLIDVTCPLR